MNIFRKLICLRPAYMFCMTCSMRLMLRLCERQRCPGRGPGWALAGSGGREATSATGPDGTRKVPGAQSWQEQGARPSNTRRHPQGAHQPRRLNLGASWPAKLGSTSCSTTLLPECRSNWDGRLNWKPAAWFWKIVSMHCRLKLCSINYCMTIQSRLQTIW